MADRIDSLCMTWRHDYGLHKADDDDSISSGMTTAERESLRRKMTQIHAHHIAPLEERIRELERDKADWLKANAPGGWIDDLRRASQPGSGGALAKALAMYDSMRDGIGGCTDGGCVIKRPTGMRTNGGCKCATDKYKAQRMMYAGQKLADAARASLDGPREG